MFRKQMAPSCDSQWEIQVGRLRIGRLNFHRMVAQKDRGKLYWDWRR